MCPRPMELGPSGTEFKADVEFRSVIVSPQIRDSISMLSGVASPRKLGLFHVGRGGPNICIETLVAQKEKKEEKRHDGEEHIHHTSHPSSVVCVFLPLLLDRSLGGGFPRNTSR